MKNKLWMCLFAAALAAAEVVSAQDFGPILREVATRPGKLVSPLNPEPKPVEKFTYIACYDYFTGLLGDCAFDITIKGLKSPTNDPDNNAGHAHGGTRPLGKIKQTKPTETAPDTVQKGQTSKKEVEISHEIPEASGKLEVETNLRVPPGTHTVIVRPCDATSTSWCFLTTVDIGVRGLQFLPASAFYTKDQGKTSQHPGEAAYFGTPNAISNLTAIANEYNDMTLSVLSINDLSLMKGGVLDIAANYTAPHITHRIGQSADINKPAGQDCRTAIDLQRAVNWIMPAEARSRFASRPAPSMGRFLCETKNNNNIHIDFD